MHRIPPPPLRVFLTFVIVGILLTQMARPAALSAEGSSDTTSTSSSSTEEPVRCLDAIADVVKEDTDDMIAFLTEHFKSEEQNSALLEIAVEKYRAYKDVLDTLLATYATQITEQDIFSQSDALFSCQELVTSNLKKVRDVLVAHNKEIAMSKKTIALSEAYQALNEQLRNLNLTVGTLVAFFEKLNGAVTCYPKGCVK